MLYNLSVQGPCLSTNWTGNPAMAVLPMDKVFVVVVADMWHFSDTDGPRPFQDSAVEAWFSNPDSMTYEQYKEARDDYVKRHKLNNRAELDEIGSFKYFKELQEDEHRASPTFSATGRPGDTERYLTNFRLRLTTSSEMINDSGLAFGGDGTQTQRSRMGLEISNVCTEYIVGGWCIGTVMDAAASRAAGHLGANLGVRSAPNTAALSVYVNISWCAAAPH